MTVILVYVRKTEEIYRHGTGLQRFEEKNSNSDTDRWVILHHILNKWASARVVYTRDETFLSYPHQCLIHRAQGVTEQFHEYEDGLDHTLVIKSYARHQIST